MANEIANNNNKNDDDDDTSITINDPVVVLPPPPPIALPAEEEVMMMMTDDDDGPILVSSVPFGGDDGAAADDDDDDEFPTITTDTVTTPSTSSQAIIEAKKKIQCFERTAVVHTILGILLFVSPYFLSYDDRLDEREQIWTPLLAILILGGIMIIITITMLCIACCCKKWDMLSTRMKILAFYPLIVDVIVIVAMILVNRVATVESSCSDSSGCRPIIDFGTVPPTSNNHTTKF